MSNYTRTSNNSTSASLLVHSIESWVLQKHWSVKRGLPYRITIFGSYQTDVDSRPKSPIDFFFEVKLDCEIVKGETLGHPWLNRVGQETSLSRIVNSFECRLLFYWWGEWHHSSLMDDSSESCGWFGQVWLLTCPSLTSSDQCLALDFCWVCPLWFHFVSLVKSIIWQNFWF